MNKPTKPNIVIPESFAENGIKTDFDNEKLTNGFDRLQPDVLAGDNLNKLIDDTYKGLNYAMAGVDAVNLIQEDEVLTVKNGELVSDSLANLKNKITNCILEAPNGVATYSGNTITVKQGLKVLIPDGRNADGTLKNIEYTFNEDKSITVSSRSLYGIFDYNYETDTLDWIWIDNLLTGLDSNKPITVQNTLVVAYYAIDTNKWYATSGSTTANWLEKKYAFLGQFLNPSGTITEFKNFEVLDLLKRSNKSEISGWGMPSDKYIDLTFGASGTEYIAPANGWFWFLGSWTNANGYVQLRSVQKLYRVQTPNNTTSGYHGLMLPITKGDSCMVLYNTTPANVYFRFIYAEGEV